ncbi:MAG: hypothetical protein IPN38_10400 [Flavobacteriales bacterium]|nr:hypothetical protein [Flavobacteriales bacterium]
MSKWVNAFHYMVKNRAFISILAPEPSNEDEKPYLGMGNPDADILFVGSEKALDKARLIHGSIIRHELSLNFAHWHDILTRSSPFDPFDPTLLARSAPLNGFNPYSPLLFPSTLAIVSKYWAGRTYAGMERLMNAYEDLKKMPKTAACEQIAFHSSIFSKVFITELSDLPATSQSKARFRLTPYLSSPRYHFMTGIAANFYTGFRTVVVYCGRNPKYVGKVGSCERLQIVRPVQPGA